MTNKIEKSQSSTTPAGERIAKVLARAGIASRREVERLILEKRVSVNGKTITSPALNVTSSDRLAVDGEAVKSADETRVWRYHKVTGCLTTNSDPQGRPTIFQKLPPELPRVVTVGRLDFNTEGLLLLTNDGELARHLELPQNAWLRHYRARVHGKVDTKRLQDLEKGVMIDGIRYEPVKAVLEKEQADGANSWIAITIREGKNREVRKVLEFVDLQVTRLIRVAFGPFQLAKLPRGGLEEVPRRVLHEQLGKFFDGKTKD